ncbi:hypothetical protein DL93DRAFT_1187470 [Clavulina sp. PMI_390]|nr:hypothetical protein DL93DRAFT_1187470 [Clavulina sp. PMI_390]
MVLPSMKLLYKWDMVQQLGETIHLWGDNPPQWGNNPPGGKQSISGETIHLWGNNPLWWGNNPFWWGIEPTCSSYKSDSQEINRRPCGSLGSVTTTPRLSYSHVIKIESDNSTGVPTKLSHKSFITKMFLIAWGDPEDKLLIWALDPTIFEQCIP